MVSVSNWNVRAGENIVCWTCEHFQRYVYPTGGNGDPVMTLVCEGECRKYPPRNNADVIDENDITTRLDLNFCAFIPFGPIAWCSGYQKSLEASIPDPPGTTQQECPHSGYLDMILPYQYNVEYPSPDLPYSKKPQSESCWYCAHFQRKYETEVQSPDMCGGFCCIEAPRSDNFSRDISAPPPWPVQDFVWLFPFINFGPAYWCSRWERTALTVPAPYVGNLGPCRYSPV